jgi:hypothetical protein
MALDAARKVELDQVAAEIVAAAGPGDLLPDKAGQCERPGILFRPAAAYTCPGCGFWIRVRPCPACAARGYQGPRSEIANGPEVAQINGSGEVGLAGYMRIDN